MRRPLIPVLAALLVLIVAPAASASFVTRHGPPHVKRTAQIVNGSDASPGEYPAQGALFIDTNNNTADGYESVCGGTLVGTRQFLTAAHCATTGNIPRTASSFAVVMGDLTPFSAPGQDVYFVRDNHVNAAWDRSTFSNDTAMLTLTRPASAYEPMRVADPSESTIWAPGRPMRIIGWGTTCSVGCDLSDTLLEADVPIVADSTCQTDYSTTVDPVDPSVMVCAADPTGTATPHDTCQGDSGGPLLATDADGFYATVGVVSFGIGCANPAFPGVYARIGADPLNRWVNDRIPHASFDLDHAAVATQPVTLIAAGTDPEGPGYFTNFNWDTNADGNFDDRTGSSISMTFPTAGPQLIGVQALKPPDGDVTTFYGVFNVAPAPTPTPPPNNGGGTPPPTGTNNPPPVTTGPKGAFKVAGSLRPRSGRFSVKLSFAPATPSGTATLVVLAGTKKLATVKIPVQPGKTVTAKVKLTKAGQQLLKQRTKLKVKLRLTVNGAVATKTVTLRR